MSIFETVKQLDLITVAEQYGLSSRSGMVCCIFHEDRTPSLKLYGDHFYCFGCGAHGDVTDLTAKLFGLSPLEAAQKLAADFGLSETSEKPSIIQRIRVETEREKEQKTFRALSDYCAYLRKNKELYAPKSPDEELHPLFVESMTELDKFEYFTEIFISGTAEDRKEFLTEGGDIIAAITRKLSRGVEQACSIA